MCTNMTEIHDTGLDDRKRKLGERNRGSPLNHGLLVAGIIMITSVFYLPRISLLDVIVILGIIPFGWGLMGELTDLLDLDLIAAFAISIFITLIFIVVIFFAAGLL